MTSQLEKETVGIHILPNISRCKSKQKMKFGQLITCETFSRKIIHKIWCKNYSQTLFYKIKVENISRSVI